MPKRLAMESGQSLVEFALILPILFLLLLGLVQCGEIYADYNLIQNAAREGVRVGITGQDDAAILAMVDACTAGLDPARLTTVIEPAEDERIPGDLLAVRVTYRVPVTLLLLQPLLGAEINLSSQLQMRL